MNGFHTIPPWRKRNAAPCGAPRRLGGIALILALVSLAASAETLEGKVVGVTDGDTVTVLDASNGGHKVRVAGIDAPEKGQAFGEQSRKSLSSLVFGKPVMVEWAKRDRYGRIVGVVLVCPADSCPAPVDAGLMQIRSGLAWHYKKYEKEQSPDNREAYARAEKEARDRRIGLWADPSPVPPWEWRHR